MPRTTRRPCALLGLAFVSLALLAVLLGPPAVRARSADMAVTDDDPFVGTLFWKDSDGTTRPALAIDTDVRIRVSGLVARASVRQRFENPSDLWLEGVYVFPLPEMAAVDRMRLALGERRIEGQIQERGQAQQTYASARRAGKTASLLEQERPNLFTTSLANIGPRETVEITIEYQTTPRYDAGGFELRFPMTLTARYVPGAPGSEDASFPLAAARGTGLTEATDAVPDAPRISPPQLRPDAPQLNPLRLHVSLDAGFPLVRLSSPSHAVRTRARGTHRYEVELDDVPADRDFVLRWAPEPGSEPRAAIFSEERDGDYYVLLMLLPPDQDVAAHRMAREAVFVIDTSGSMAGASIEQARAALGLALDRLGPDDSFNVIAFDDRPRALFETSVAVSPSSLERAHAFVRGLEARGGTEMLAALQRALRDPLAEAGGPGAAYAPVRQVVFITDASIGNEAQLFAEIERRLGRSRLFMVGIGSAPNGYLLDRAATLGRGTTTRIGTPGEVQERMEALLHKLESPLLGDLALHWSDEVESWPAAVPDLYAGEPVLVTARLQRFVSDVTLSGRRGERPFELRLPLTPGTPESGIHKLWARRKIAHFMMQRASGQDPQQIRQQVLAVALAHQLVSQFTSLVAVETTPRRPSHAAGARTCVPNHGPAGFDPARVPGVLPQGATSAPLWLGLGAAALLLAAALALAERRRA